MKKGSRLRNDQINEKKQQKKSRWRLEKNASKKTQHKGEWTRIASTHEIILEGETHKKRKLK